MAKAPAPPFDLKASLLTAFAIHDRITRYLLENTPAEAWSAKPPEGEGRTIAAIAVHIHNVRLMWLKAVGAAQLHAKLERTASAKKTLQALGVWKVKRPFLCGAAGLKFGWALPPAPIFKLG
jgi:hypothetical protein